MNKILYSLRLPPARSRRRPAVPLLLRHLARRAAADNVPGVAASLAYTSLLGLVPLLAMGLAVLSAFPVFDGMRDQIQKLIFTTFVPASGLAVHEAVQRFVAATGKLTAIGVIGLAVIAVVQMLTIERAFNGIFRVLQPRPLLGRLVMYWALLTLGPLLLGGAVAFAGYVAAVGVPGVSGSQASRLWRNLSSLLPLLLTLGAFALLYLLLPNRRIRLRDALSGALVAALLFAALRFGFVQFYVRGGVFQTIYGALATVPLFLVWMYLSWMVVLVGAEVAASLPEWRQRHLHPGGDDRHWRLEAALEILQALGQGDPRGLRRAALLEQVACAEETLLEILEAFRRHALVARSDEGRWLLTSAAGTLSLYRILEALSLTLPAAGKGNDEPGAPCAGSPDGGETAEGTDTGTAGLEATGTAGTGATAAGGAGMDKSGSGKTGSGRAGRGRAGRRQAGTGSGPAMPSRLPPTPFARAARQALEDACRQQARLLSVPLPSPCSPLPPFPLPAPPASPSPSAASPAAAGLLPPQPD